MVKYTCYDCKANNNIDISSDAIRCFKCGSRILLKKRDNKTPIQYVAR